MSGAYDVAVIGGGHNGLTFAALVAKSGRNVVVLETREAVGGLAASVEFHPGFRSPGVLQDTSLVRAGLVEALGLERHGLRFEKQRPDVLALGDGNSLWLRGSTEACANEIRALSSRDAESYLKYRRFIDELRPLASAFLAEAPIDLIRPESESKLLLLRRAMPFRNLRGRRLLDLMRIPPMSVADWLGEWFESDFLKAALAIPALRGAWMGPRSPSSAANLLLWEAAARHHVKGGGPELVMALEKAALECGAEIRTKTRVERILLGPAGVTGVELAGGDRIEARAVAASCDPKQVFLRLMETGMIPHRLEHRIASYRMRGTTAQLLLALKTPLRFAARPDEVVEFARTCARLDDLEKAFDAVKYRVCSTDPVLEIHQPPDLAPQERAVVSILVHHAPYDLEGGWTDAARDLIIDRAMAVLEGHAPGVSGNVIARKLLLPFDLEREYGLTGGHLHHGEHALDQILVRPSPECAKYATPIPGLFLCGSGSHPGGGLTGAPGMLAASVV